MDYLMHAFSLSRGQRVIVESKFLESDRVKIVMIPVVPLDFFVPFTSFEHTSMFIERSYERTSRFLDAREQSEQPSTTRVLEAVTPSN
jgi:hypothetical protein